MTTTHHPGPEFLMSCSAGSMPEAFAAIMATHMQMCPQCRADLATMEHIGTALFDQISPSPLSKPAPIAVLHSLEAETNGGGTHTSTDTARNAGDVPAALVAFVGEKLDGVAWRKLAPGVWHHPIPLSKSARGQLRLIKVAPGKALPEHGHAGQEMTLVLQGSFSDATGVYRSGDVATADESTVHTPVADPSEGCICLMATLDKLEFKGPLARLVQPLTGL